MTDVFVDLGYRGLAIARKVKLAQIRPTTGYLESAAPMPVGTTVSCAVEGGFAFDAIVASVCEVQSGDRAPGMLVRPKLDGAVAAWWKERVSLPELAPPPPPRTTSTVVPKKRDDATPELIDDGRNTAVTEIPVETLVAIEAPESDPNLVDDGKRTMMMDAVDLAALGLSSSSGQMAAVTEDDVEGGNGGDNGDDRGSQPKVGGKKRRKKK